MFIKKQKFLAARFLLVLVLLNGAFFGAGSVDQVSAAAGDVTRVSVAGDGSQSNGYSDWPTLSSDGRYIAFYSLGSNLVAGDSNGFTDAFVRDVQTGTIRRVSVSSSGVQSNADSHDTVISGNGRHISFISLSTNLVPQTDTANSYDVFVHDLETGTTTAVSVSLNNELGTSGRNSYHQSISVDGRYIAFNSSRGNMVAGDTNLRSDIFVRDMQTNTMRRVSVGPNGIQSNGDSFYTNMSDDGRYITFHSSASNLVAGDTNGRIDIFVHDIQTGVTSRASLASGGVQSQNGDSLYPAISGDGRYVAFRSLANNLVPGDTNAKWDIFLHDRQTGITSLVSAPAGGGFANGDSLKAALSQDGRYVTYDSYASNLVSGDTNGQGDVFVRDTQLGTTTRVSVASSGGQALGGEAMYPSITPNGQYVIFTSFATNMVAGDTNGVADIFMYEQNIGSLPPTSTATPTSAVTATFTSSPVPTFTATSTPPPTATFTATSTHTPTFTPSATFTSTSSPTATLTATSTHTPTFTPSATFTVTSSPTATFTPTAADTATSTSTSSPTATLTATDTATSTIEPSHTLTFTPTFTPTAEDTATSTSTATHTATFTSTAQNTATFTPTATVTPSQTFTATAENTPTSTPTTLPSFTPTFTAELTPTFTPTTTPVADFPANSILDGFDRADGEMGSSWSGFRTSAFTIASNQLSVTGAGESYVYWNSISYGADQEAYFTFSQVYPSTSEQALLLKLRKNGTGTIKVVYNAETDMVRVMTYYPSQGWVQRGADIPVTFVNGDQFGARARADGTVDVYQNGVLLASRIITAWPYYAGGGYIGIGFSNVTGAVMDDFGGGPR